MEAEYPAKRQKCNSSNHEAKIGMYSQPRKKPSRSIRDPIHGQITIPGICWEIIDTPEFQRLRNLKQNGFVNRVYPSATHSRFEHSIGVCYLSGKMVDHLRNYEDISDNDKKCVMLAGLCHDLGHGPFSHVFEKWFIRRVKDQKWKHEYASLKMITYCLEKNNIDLSAYGLGRRDITFIEELINPPDEEKRSGRGRKSSFLYEIVSNQHSGLDVDKFDYLQRDSYFTGQGITDFSTNYIISQSRVKECADGWRHICFPDKMIASLLNVFRARFDLHKHVYQHRVVKAYEMMLADALILANKHIKIGKCKSLAGCVDDMQAYTILSDAIVDHIVCMSYEDIPFANKKRDLVAARDIVHRMNTRQFYKCVGSVIWDKKEELDVDKVKAWILDESSTLEEDDIKVVKVECNYGAKDGNPLDMIWFYSKATPDEARRLDSSKYETLLPREFQDINILVYCKEDSKILDAKEAFAAWAEDNQAPSPMLSYRSYEDV